MPNLTPEQIFNGYKNKEVDKPSAERYLRLFIEESHDEKIRVESLNYLGNLISNGIKSYKFFENLVTSDEDYQIRRHAANILIEQYPDEAIKVIKWIIEHETSPECLVSIYNVLDNSSKNEYKELKRLLIDTIRDPYYSRFGLLAEEALILSLIQLFVGRLSYDKTYSRHENDLSPMITFSVKDGHVAGIYILAYGCDYTYPHKSHDYLRLLKNLPHLKSLQILGTGIEQIEGLVNLTELEVLKLWRNKIQEIKGLEKLTNFKSLDLSFNEIKEIKGIETLTNLEELILSSNKITEIKGLATLTNLKKLRIEHNEIDEIKGLETLKNLEELYLFPNPFIYKDKNLDFNLLKVYNTFGYRSAQDYVEYCRKIKNTPKISNSNENNVERLLLFWKSKADFYGMKAHDTENQIIAYERILEFDPKNMEAWERLSHFYLFYNRGGEKKTIETIEKAYKYVLELDPYNLESWKTLLSLCNTFNFTELTKKVLKQVRNLEIKDR